MKTYTFTLETTIHAPLETVFEFFSSAENLERITPAFLRFKILTPKPIAMGEGTRIDYRLRLFGIPMRWTSRIDRWDPPRGFMDVQMKGPYAKWEHEHTFRADGDSTIMRDVVEYALPGGPLAPIAHALFVKRQVAEIFRYRGEAISECFAP